VLNLWKYFQKSLPVVLGVDINQTTVRVVELSFQQNQWQLHACAVANYTESNFSDVLRSLIKANKFSVKKVAIFIPDSLTYKQNLLISKLLTPKEIEEAVAIEAKRYVLDDSVDFDFQITGTSAQNSDLFAVQIIAARHTWITQRIACLKRSGLTVVNIEPKSHAILRVLAQTYPYTDELLLLLDVDHLDARIYVMQNHQLIFDHEEVWCDREFSNDPVILCELFCNWVNRMCQLFYASHNDVVITRCVLSGEFHLSQIWMRELEKSLKVTIDLFVLPAKIDLNSAWVTAFGLAMCEIKS
jgi:type IV pilus assembly protein PilM